MPGDSYEKVMEIAAGQHGYLTTSQAREHGVSKDALRMMAKRSVIDRISWGLYRVPSLPPSDYSEFMKAALWPSETTGVISHESALSLYGLSDVSPGQIHITLPADYRTHRDIPGRFHLHHADLDDSEIRRMEGVPVTTPTRTIRDCHEAGIGTRLLRQAIDEGQREGFLTPQEADGLRDELLP